jgi:hypothetical protein
MARAPRNYLSNANILEELRKCKDVGKMNKEFTNMMIMLCDKYANSGCFASYTYLDDMKSYALLNIVKNWNSFNLERSNNPFAYYTQNIKNSFRQYLNQEKKHRNIRDMLIVAAGADPSFTFKLEHEIESGYDVRRQETTEYTLEHE